MPAQNDARFRNQAFEIYLRDTYILNFRANMKTAFPKLPEPEVESTHAWCKGLLDGAWDLFKQVLYQQCTLSDARSQLRAKDPSIEERNWLHCEGVSINHLLKFSDKSSTSPDIWSDLESIVQDYYHPYQEPKSATPGEHQPSVPVKARTGPAPRKPTESEVKQFPALLAQILDNVLNQALEFSLEWGENFGKPIRERILRVYPSLSDTEIMALEDRCSQIKSVAWKACEEEYNAQISEGETRYRVQDIFPGISEENLARLKSQGMYYAWRG